MVVVQTSYLFLLVSFVRCFISLWSYTGKHAYVICSHFKGCNNDNVEMKASSYFCSKPRGRISSYGDLVLVYKFKKIMARTDFSDQFGKIIIRLLAMICM